MEESGNSLDSDSASSTEVLTTFHPYPRLPPEMKLQIWKYAFGEWSNGAHRLRLFVDPNRCTRLIYEPSNKAANDVSVWRQRVGMASLDRYAFDQFLRFETTATLLHQYDTPGRKNPDRVLFNDKTDLVTFRFDYGETIISLVMLNGLENYFFLKGITRIGVEWDFLRRVKGSKSFQPFRCVRGEGGCLHPTDHPAEICNKSVCRFLRWFRDLQEFYLICPTKKSMMTAESEAQHFCPRKLEGLFPKKENTVITKTGVDVFRRLQEIAQEKGLKEFCNRTGAYCEIRLEDTQNLFHPTPDPWLLLSGLKDEWYSRRPSHPGQAKVKFKMLAWSDLRGVTVGEDGPVLRTAGPWK